jgi:hypothetical protein
MSLATKRSKSSYRTGASTDEPTEPGTAPAILPLLRRLDAARIRYRLEQTRDDAIAVEVTVPGERWEIEFLESGEVAIEIFRSSGDILDSCALADLFARFSD